MVRLGRILVDASDTRDEGRRLLAAAVADAPDWTFARRTLAMAWADDDPARGLELLAPALADDDLYVNEVHALLLEAAGQGAEAERVTRRVIAAHDGPPVAALTRMCAWNWSGNRYERALSWARRLRATTLADRDDPDDVVDTWLTAFRLAGRVDEVLPELRERYREVVPAVVARALYLAVGHHDRELAARAADVVAAAATTDGERLEWRIEAAKMRGLGGEVDAVRALHGEATTLATAEGWANLAWGFARLKQWDDANAAADAALAADPRDVYALTASLEASMRRGDVAGALALARRVHELYPYDHRGPERLAELHAKSLEPAPAVAFAERALEAAPYCHHAQGYGALAFLVAGDRARARRHAEQALRLTPPDEDDAYDASLIVVRAVTGDLAGLDRCLASSPEPAAALAPFFARLRAIASGGGGET
jgi:tetratricopeptide (TPR) repeat protein